jgi:hypothetical protein
MLGKFNAAKRSTPYRQVAALLFAFLWGCGGGGGGGGGGGPAGLTPPPSTPVGVTASNATQVSATALKPAVGGGGALTTVAGIETTAAPQTRAVTRALLAVARESKTQLSGSQSVVGAAARTTPCKVSGSITADISADGTSGTITFNACSDIAGETISGSASATGVSAAPDGSHFSGNFSVDITFTETGFAPARLVGSFSIGETCNTSTHDCTSTFTGTSLGAQQGNETWFITNFMIREALVHNTQNNTQNVTVTFNYTASSTALNGSVTVITSTPLQMLTSARHPYTGVVVATGKNSSKVRLTVLGSDPTAPGQVQIEVDADGDGTYESSTLYSWSTLDAL